ncbi:agmatine deiminase family protein [Mucilaginibacter sp. Bleaf8]|uniref:agmatine deiminase family protein n=1 Tax=Mucilaginibacter sp. Bleaf8 TaxID=2834430 RepID=UPI001BCABE49|nr:agmatine deiminase family protein [Mucilaginibacter sp. Bleaf8]MBS7563926.1 agmatine deiminase family protein [Mucilaginibacter sp. Bleaf8]
MSNFENSPAKQGYTFPAEWETHTATWLSWPHKEASWPGKIESIYANYCAFIKEVAQGELVRINVANQQMQASATQHLQQAGVDLNLIEFYEFPTNDAWCRDHGPAFLVNRSTKKKAVVDWGYNAWGGKYPPYDLDDVIPTRIAEHFNLPVFNPGIVMEGGSVDFNGAGTLLTTTACLLNKNRNPHLKQSQIEEYLHNYYGVQQILWLGDGIVGDDTDGHIDDITRFVNEDTVVTVVEENKSDENYAILQHNLQVLKGMRLPNGKQLNVIELPMPTPVIHEDQLLPASYANFYISNAAVVVPTYRSDSDQKALDIIQQCFPQRKVVGIDSTDIIWGLGSFHCLSQQEPEI